MVWAVSLWIWCIAVVDSCMLNLPRGPGVNPTWWCCIILSICCQIWSASVLLETSTSLFIREMSRWLSCDAFLLSFIELHKPVHWILQSVLEHYHLFSFQIPPLPRSYYFLLGVVFKHVSDPFCLPCLVTPRRVSLSFLVSLHYLLDIFF